MNDDEHTIRDIIERWAVAAHTGDLMTVTSHHAPGIVMFDVPRRRTVSGAWTHTGKRGPASSSGNAGHPLTFCRSTLSRATTWPSPMDCSAVERQELTAVPERRLRLTMGLRKLDGQWTILHEHHSFTARD